ncbi:hypothetical protein GJV26_26975 [Massilia dura]|uniref:Uncharacterized protein n=2 Tax=Pseudoduganella dura TaxID=321982 RepID=A0A6I3XGR4_9BURK|nr:hypothetical protein [Pseudoduganella dura]MUI16074.1 hypothetical protein [Pseudoduganella dura]GGY21785.1 hypothetical protein GCM10007386_57890 [Pseudoduganella dura]
MGWAPISEAELWDKIIGAEGRMSPHIFRLWEVIKITPEKWSEKSYGMDGGGFWVVAVIGNRAIWFNDIEDGFNCSSYIVTGKLTEYFCNQDELEMAVQNILTIIEVGHDFSVRCSAPIPGEWMPG